VRLKDQHQEKNARDPLPHITTPPPTCCIFELHIPFLLYLEERKSGRFQVLEYRNLTNGGQKFDRSHVLGNLQSTSARQHWNRSSVVVVGGALEMMMRLRAIANHFGGAVQAI
jgi:hypothetical protein